MIANMIFNPNKIYGHTDKFPFGKYKGKSLGYVLEKEPDYFIWLDKEIHDFKITKGIMELIYFIKGFKEEYC